MDELRPSLSERCSQNPKSITFHPVFVDRRSSSFHLSHMSSKHLQHLSSDSALNGATSGVNIRSNASTADLLLPVQPHVTSPCRFCC